MTAPRRIHIVGGPGSGKSVTAALLARRTGAPAFDLDELFWKNTSGAYGVKASPEERDAALAAILERPAWITEGVYHSWVARCYREADVVLILGTPVWLRHRRIVARFIRRRLGLESSKRESLRDLVRLLRWNHAYDRSILAQVRSALDQLGREPVECRGRMDALRAIECHPTRG
jgi:adenylate kinase family enzyme